MCDLHRSQSLCHFSFNILAKQQQVKLSNTVSDHALLHQYFSCTEELKLESATKMEATVQLMCAAVKLGSSLGLQHKTATHCQ